VTLKLGFGVTQGHRKQHYSIEHIRLYIRFPLSIWLYLLLVPRYSRIFVKNCYPFVFGAPVAGEAVRLRNDPWWRNTRMMGLSDRDRISMIPLAVLIQYTHVTDRQTQTDRQCRVASRGKSDHVLRYRTAACTIVLKSVVVPSMHPAPWCFSSGSVKLMVIKYYQLPTGILHCTFLGFCLSCVWVIGAPPQQTFPIST